MLHKTFRTLIDDAQRAQRFIAHTPPGFQEPTAMIPQSMARSTVACLRTENLPSLFNEDGDLVRAPHSTPAATSFRIEAGVIAASRVAAAGDHVLVCPEPSQARPVGKYGDIALESRLDTFRTIEAAAFSSVSDEADVPLSAMPVSVAKIDLSRAITKGFRIELPRAFRKDVDPDLVTAEIVAALTLGLGRAADEVLLSKIVAVSPERFALAQVAKQGLKFDELRALIGTNGEGASIAEDGTLRAAGILAELTADVAPTVIGAWNRAAVAIHEAVDVHFERTSLNGDLIVTAWAHLLALVPDPKKFWTVGAA